MTPITQENLSRIHEAGGILALGTEHTIGAALHREMEHLVDAGIAPIEVNSISTRGGARFLDKAQEVGSVEEGKPADLVLLDADPLADIDNAKRIAAIIKGGRVIDRGALALPIKSPTDWGDLQFSPIMENGA